MPLTSLNLGPLGLSVITHVTGDTSRPQTEVLKIALMMSLLHFAILFMLFCHSPEVDTVLNTKDVYCNLWQ